VPATILGRADFFIDSACISMHHCEMSLQFSWQGLQGCTLPIHCLAPEDAAGGMTIQH